MHLCDLLGMCLHNKRDISMVYTVTCIKIKYRAKLLRILREIFIKGYLINDDAVYKEVFYFKTKKQMNI